MTPYIPQGHPTRRRRDHATPTRATSDATPYPSVIPYIPVRFGRVHPTPGITALRNPEDPVELALLLETQGAPRLFVDFLDELAELDRALRTLRSITGAVRCPVIASLADGALTAADDLDRFLDAGAQGYAFNTCAVAHPDWIDRARARHGSSSALGMIRARRVTADWWEPMVERGAEATGLDAISWAHELRERGVSELVVHSLDRAGRGWGYDLDLTRAVADTIGAPVIASGGAALPQDLVAGFSKGHATAVMVDEMILTGRCSLETATAFVRTWSGTLTPRA